jgi:hypothetical protein
MVDSYTLPAMQSGFLRPVPYPDISVTGAIIYSRAAHTNATPAV